MNTTMIVDTLWVVFAALLVFFMNLGFASGRIRFCKIKKYGNILSRTLLFLQFPRWASCCLAGD